MQEQAACHRHSPGCLRKRRPASEAPPAPRHRGGPALSPPRCIAQIFRKARSAVPSQAAPTPPRNGASLSSLKAHQDPSSRCRPLASESWAHASSVRAGRARFSSHRLPAPLPGSGADITPRVLGGPPSIQQEAWEVECEPTTSNIPTLPGAPGVGVCAPPGEGGS